MMSIWKFLGWFLYAVHLWICIHARFSRALPPKVPPKLPRALLSAAAPPRLACLPSQSRQVQKFSFSWLLLAREAGASKRLPCLAERAGSPGKGTPVRVGNLPMKSECVHTKALTPGGSRTP